MQPHMLISAMLLVSASLAAQDVVIINAGIDRADVTNASVSDVVGGKKVKWSNGALVILVIQPDSPLHEQFLKRYTSKSPAQFVTTWKKIVFTGKGSPPLECGSDNDVIATVAAHPGSIGYIDAASVAAAGKTPSVVVISEK